MSNGPAPTRCPGCGFVAPDTRATPPPRYDASSGCWDRYELLLARSYGDPAYGAVHQLVVDGYVVQHPRGDSRDQIQQVALCLMTLALFIEDGIDVRQGPRLHQRMVANLPELWELSAPNTDVGMTVDDVLNARDAEEHRRLVLDWATRLWAAWAPHHTTIRTWTNRALPE